MADFEISRATHVVADPATVHALIDDFRQWTRWSPWEDADPDLQRTYGGSDHGVGSTYQWSGNAKAGEGRMEIVSSTPSEVVVDLRFVKPFKATNVTTFSLRPSEGGTDVTWTMTGQRSAVMGVMGRLFFDKVIGKDFDKGLAAMKRTAEASRPPRSHASVTYRYGSGWNVRLKKPKEEFDEATARQCFAQGPMFAVSRVAEGQDVADFTLHVAAEGSHVRVQRYDANGSVVEVYDYAYVDGDDRLFMDNYKLYVYADDARTTRTFSQSVAHKSWVFRKDGTATCREVVKPLPDAKISQYRDLDVSGHWRARPSFGDWDGYGEHPEPGGAG